NGVTVVDFLPAGLEYLGLGGIDNTTNANGTQATQNPSEPWAEYPDAGHIGTSTLTPAWAQTAGERVETIIATAADQLAYGLVAGEVYTKVTWNLGTLLAQGGDGRDTDIGVKQVYAGTAGTPGMLQIQYLAAVPL